MQVPLLFEFQCNQTFDNYYCGNNREIVGQLQALASDGMEQQIFIWGDAGSGKTHLSQACCGLATSLGKESFYLVFEKDRLPSPAILEGLESLDLICFDDFQHVAGSKVWQEHLFNFYNRHRQANHRLLVAADCPPKYLPFDLLDLKTRMGWGLTLKIQALHGEQLIEALNQKAHGLGFDIPRTVGRFLLNHYVHDLPALWELLEQIDHATLAAQRRLTVPFLKSILANGFGATKFRR